MPTVFGYARASTNKQTETLEVQQERLKKEYEHRYQVQGCEYGFHADPATSGDLKFANRIAGFRIESAAERGDVIMVTKLDRGFRNALDFMEAADRWAKKGVAFVCLDMGLDTGTPVGRMVAGILAVVAQFERERISERTRDALAHRKATGKPVGGGVPYGMMRTRDKRRRPSLRRDNYTRRLGALFLQWYEDGWTSEAIYFHCLEHKIKTRLQGEWSEPAIRRAIEGERALQALAKADGRKELI